MVGGAGARLRPIDSGFPAATIPHPIVKEVALRQAAVISIPVLALALGVFAVLLAQPGMPPNPVEPYKFTLGPDITAEAADVTIEPRFRGVVDDRFAYEAYFNATRTGTVTDAGKPVETFRVAENWIDLFTLIVSEDPLDGHKDPQLRFQYEIIEFAVDNGKARYSGYIGPAQGNRKAGFKEILPDGKRSDVTNIPGWAGVNANVLEMNRSTQQRDFGAAAWFSVAETGRLYNELYYADWSNADQTNFPGRLQEPLHLALGTHPQFNESAKLKLGESVTVRRRMPISAVAGGATEYDVTYKLERLYGTKAEPTAARLTFDAVPVQRDHTVVAGGLETKFTAPDIKGGRLLLDLAKGVAAHVQWGGKLEGTVAQQGTGLLTRFEVKLDFAASLRATKETAE